MNATTNYGLKKPIGTEYYSLANVNDNWDTIDAQLKNIDTKFGYTIYNTSNDITLASSNSIVFCDTTNNNITVTLPTAINSKYQYIIKKVDSSSNTIIINTSDGDLIEKDTVFVFSDSLKSLTIVSNGSKWYTVNQTIVSVTKENVDTTKVWEVQLSGKEQNFSTPIVYTLPDLTKCVITSTYDWYINCYRLSDGQLLWRHATNAPCYGRCAAVTIDNQAYIFGSSHDGSITCLDETGSVRYIHKNLYDREGTGTISSAGSFYFTDSTKNWVKDSFIRGTQGLNAKVKIISGTASGEEHEISGIDENDHTKIWLFDNWSVQPDSSSQYIIEPKYPSDKYYQHAGTIFEENGIAYLVCCGFDGQIVKLRIVDNTIMWRFSTRESIEPFPLVETINGEVQIFITSLDKNVYSFSKDGLLNFKTALPDGCDAFLEYDYNLGLLISCRDNKVYRIDTQTGAVLSFSTDTNGDIDNRPTVFTIPGEANKSVVIGNDNSDVYCFDGSTLDIKWKHSTNGGGINSSIVIEDINNDGYPEILVSDMYGKISILNPWGREIGQLFARGGIEGTPNLYIDEQSNKFLIVSSLDGYLKCIKFNK